MVNERMVFMIRIKEIQTLENYILKVTFEDNHTVEYDVKEDMGLPGYADLKHIKGLWKHATLDESRTCVTWNDYIDLSSDILREYGKPIVAKQK